MNQPAYLCPHCGADLERATVLKAGSFSYSDVGGFRTDMKPLKVGGAVHLILGKIMAGRGAAITEETLRTSTTTNSNVVSVQLSKAKRAVSALGLDWPIERTLGKGWFWDGPPVH